MLRDNKGLCFNIVYFRLFVMSFDSGYPAEKLPLFAGLSSSEIKSVVSAARFHSCKKNEQLFVHGDPATHVYVLEKGAVRLHRQTPEGKEITLQIVIAGDMIGELDLLENKTHHQFAATATEDSTLLAYPLWVMREQLKTCPTLALNLLSTLSRKSSRSMIDNEHLQMLKAPQRIGCFLMRLCEIHGFDPAHFVLPYSKSTIASKLGMEPESFSRALAKLKEIGVSIVGNEVNVADLPVLESYVCAHCSLFHDCETRHDISEHLAPAHYPQQA